MQIWPLTAVFQHQQETLMTLKTIILDLCRVNICHLVATDNVYQIWRTEFSICKSNHNYSAVKAPNHKKHLLCRNYGKSSVIWSHCLRFCFNFHFHILGALSLWWYQRVDFWWNRWDCTTTLQQQNPVNVRLLNKQTSTSTGEKQANCLTTIIIYRHVYNKALSTALSVTHSNLGMRQDQHFPPGMVIPR